MKSEWKEVKLSDIADVIDSLHKTPQYVEKGIPMIRVTDIKEGYLSLNSALQVSNDVYDEFTKKYKPQIGDIVISRVGTYGVFSYVAEDKQFCLGQNTSIIIPKINSKFLFYWLISPYTKHYLNTIVTGSTQKTISLKNIKTIPLYLPNNEIQIRIADILSAIDDKIALNQQINNNLEQQAQAIFKSWFVDFEPFKDREFIDSEYGKIPKGWQYKQIGELCKSISVKHKFNKDKLIFLNTGDIENGKFINCNLMSVADMPGQAKKSISKGDILYSEIRPINKHFAYVNFKANDYVVSTKLMVIRAEKIDSRRLYNYLTSNKVIEELQLEAETRSGTFPQIKFDNISRLPILIADNKTETKFIEILYLFYKKIDCNNDEIEKLIKVRDILLPRLMSGKIKF